ncbi:hypothetical protein BDW72DRAFT_55632 [Aspergillus terricola var. indicus]
MADSKSMSRRWCKTKKRNNARLEYGARFRVNEKYPTADRSIYRPTWNGTAYTALSPYVLFYLLCERIIELISNTLYLLWPFGLAFTSAEFRDGDYTLHGSGCVVLLSG